MSLRNVILLSFAGILWSCVLGLQRPAPRYSQQFMPETAFTCRNKIVGSYYADPETDCQLFHVCVSVAGLVQDYKFLCPNDTAFDQESQTCADWYDVDCEAATLYYASDNFDLYRLGSGLESLHYDSLRSDAEPQDHLQRSESNDPVRSAANNLNRVAPQSNSNSRDILRGSSSSNFYNSRNNVKDEDYDSEKAYRDEPIVEPKKKPGVRKLARKQQLNSNNNNNNYNNNKDVPSSTAAPSSTANYNTYNNDNNNNYNNRNHYNNHRTTYEPTTTTTTVRPTQDYNTNNDNNNYNNNNRNYYNNHRTTYEPTTTTTVRPAQDYTSNQRNVNQNQNAQKYNTPSTFRPATSQQYSTYQAPSTTVKTTAYNNNNYNQQKTNYQAAPTTVKPFVFSQNFQQGTSPRPTTYNQNYQDNYSGSNAQYNQNNNNNQKNQYNQNSRVQPTTIAPTTNYQQTDFPAFQQRNYNNIQRSSTAFPTTTTAGTTFYDAYNANNQFTGKTNGVTKNAQTTNNKYYQTYSTGSYAPTTYAPVTNNKKASEGNVRGGDRYNADDSDDGEYFDKSQKSTPFFDVTKAPKKIAQYNNYDNTGKYFEASTVNYDFGRSSAIGFSPSSINLLAETPKTTTPVPRRNGSPTTYNPGSFNGNNQRGIQQETTPRPATYNSSSRPFSTTVKIADATTPRPKAPKKNDYDYAYYDNAGALEYDALDLEHVAGGKESSKITRN